MFSKRIETTFERKFQMALGRMRLSVNSSKHTDGFWLSVTSLSATKDQVSVCEVSEQTEAVENSSVDSGGKSLARRGTET